MTSIDKVIEAIRKKFPEASTEEVQQFAMAIIDYGKRVRKQTKRKPFKWKDIKMLLQKKGGGK